MALQCLCSCKPFWISTAFCNCAISSDTLQKWPRHCKSIWSNSTKVILHYYFFIHFKQTFILFTRSFGKVTNHDNTSVFKNVFKKQLKIGRPKREIIPMQTISAQVAAIGVAPLGIPNWGSLGENHILNSPYI